MRKRGVEHKYAAGQLRLLHTEIDRQLADVLGRHSEFNTRAGFVLAAAAAIAFGQTVLHGNIVFRSVGFLLLAISLVFSLLALVLVKTPRSNLAGLTQENWELYLRADLYSVEFRIVEDSRMSLRNAEKSLIRKGAYLNVAFVNMALALVAVAVATSLPSR